VREQACPVFIENVPRLIDMRRYKVQVEADFPPELQRVFEGMERQGNPWGIGQDKRDEWEGDVPLPKWGDGGTYEYLFYVGCAGSYDDRMKKVSRAVAKVLTEAGVSSERAGRRRDDRARRAQRSTQLGRPRVLVGACILMRYAFSMALHLAADLEMAVGRFLGQVVESGRVWVLVTPARRGVTLESHERFGEGGEPLRVELAFSEPARLTSVAHHWPDCTPLELSLARYLEALNAFGDRLVIVDPTTDLAGIEISPVELSQAIVSTLQSSPPDVRLLAQQGAPTPVSPPAPQSHDRQAWPRGELNVRVHGVGSSEGAERLLRAA
jgi:hypothetical protein